LHTPLRAHGRDRSDRDDADRSHEWLFPVRPVEFPSLRAKPRFRACVRENHRARLLPPGIESGDDVREHLAWVGGSPGRRPASGGGDPFGRSRNNSPGSKRAVGDDGAVHSDRPRQVASSLRRGPPTSSLRTSRDGAGRSFPVPATSMSPNGGTHRVHEAVAVGDVQLAFAHRCRSWSGRTGAPMSELDRSSPGGPLATPARLDEARHGPGAVVAVEVRPAEVRHAAAAVHVPAGDRAGSEPAADE
jgi:hypothetical protein